MRHSILILIASLLFLNIGAAENSIENDLSKINILEKNINSGIFNLNKWLDSPKSDNYEQYIKWLEEKINKFDKIISDINSLINIVSFSIVIDLEQEDLQFLKNQLLKGSNDTRRLLLEIQLKKNNMMASFNYNKIFLEQLKYLKDKIDIHDESGVSKVIEEIGIVEVKEILNNFIVEVDKIDVTLTEEEIHFLNVTKEKLNQLEQLMPFYDLQKRGDNFLQLVTQYEQIKRGDNRENRVKLYDKCSKYYKELVTYMVSNKDLFERFEDFKYDTYLFKMELDEIMASL